MPRKTLYIAYGSNINLQQMAYRCPTAKPVHTGMLKGFELQFKGVATIAPKENSQVPVLLWKLKPSDEKSLDRYEGYPSFYRKEIFDVKIKGKVYEAMVYIMNGNTPLSEPSEQYYNSIEKGYIDNDLDTRYLEQALEDAVLSQKNDPGEEYIYDETEGFQMKFD
jgi:gamma-glutamylcyclotransferase (GGCT)/AIG2-like uncharacterized protein YtfP